MQKHAKLFHNEEAGFEKYSSDYLQDLLQQIGYASTAIDTKTEDISERCAGKTDLIVIAGGDGTVGKVCKNLVGTDIPIGILPLGTANNLATSLGISGEPEDIISSWRSAKLQPFDVGVVDDGEKRSYFFESIGFGLFPRLIRKREDEESEPTREEELEDAVEHQLHILRRYKSHNCKVIMDNERLSGRYLMVEVMNGRYLGANLCLAPHADLNDALLDVFLAKEDEREALEHFLKESLNGNATHHSLPIHRTRKLTLEWDGKYYHRDDKCLKQKPPVRLKVWLQAKGLYFLAH